jgi:hypothetical protein
MATTYKITTGTGSATYKVTTGTGSATYKVTTGARGPLGPAGNPTIISPTAPVSPANGQGWLDSSTGILSFWSSSDDAWITSTRPPLDAAPAEAITLGGDYLTLATDYLTLAAA